VAVQIILFDLDGTLVRAGGSGAGSMSVAFNNLFHRENAFARISFTGMTDPLILRKAFHHTFNRDPRPDEFETFFQEYLKILKKQVPKAEGYEVLPGIPALIHGLTARGLSIGLATGNLKDGARIKLERSDLWQPFPFGGFGSDSENRTRLTEMAIQRGSARLGHDVNPRDCMIIGDSPAEHKVARELGAKVLLVGTGWTDTAELQRLEPDLFFQDFSDWQAVTDAITNA